MVGPSFFDEWNKERTGLLMSLNAARRKGTLISMAANGSGGRDHRDFFRLAQFGRRLRSRINDADHGHIHSLRDLGKCEGGRRVAGDHHHLGAVLPKKLAGGDGVFGYCLGRLRAIRQSRRVAKVKVIGLRHLADKFLQYGESAHTGIEDADLHCIAFTSACTSLTLYVPIRSACPERVSRSLPSTMIFTRVICGTLIASVSIIEAIVSDSTRTPERCWFAKSLLISTTARFRFTM